LTFGFVPTAKQMARLLDCSILSKEYMAVKALLHLLDDDPEREGLRETPRRFIDAMLEATAGRRMDPASILKVFEDGAEGVDQMVTVASIPLWSLCEHHLAPFHGVAHVSYIPKGKVVGLSKLARLVECYAKRLQVQERLTEQVATALETHLECRGVGVMVQARHLCMESRGVRAHGAVTVTTSLRGSMKRDARARSEFLDMCRSHS